MCYVFPESPLDRGDFRGVRHRRALTDQHAATRCKGHPDPASAGDADGARSLQGYADDGPRYGRSRRGCRIAFLKPELKITDAQMPLWNAVADAIRAAPKDMAQMQCMSSMQSMMEQQSSTLPEKLAAREKTMTAHLEAFRKFKAAVEPLYPALSDEQKKTADQLLLGPMGMMGWE